MTDAEKQQALEKGKKIDALRGKIFWWSFGVAVAIGLIVGMAAHPFFGIGSFFAIFGSILLSGIKEIPSVPEPHVGLLLYKRGMVPVVLKAGWRFLPFRPWLFDIEELNAAKEDFDLAPLEVRTPDKARMAVRVSLTIRLDAEDPFACMEYVAAKRLAGVKANMDQLVDQATRRTICSEGEGPQTWMEAQGANSELNHSLLKEIVGESITAISANFPGKDLPPSWILMKYFDSPRPNLTESEAKRFTSWDAIKSQLEGQLKPAELVELKKLVEKRRAEVKAVSSSNGKFKKVPFGVFVERIAVGGITLLDEDLIKAAATVAAEQAERESETTEADHSIEMLARLQRPVSEGGAGLSTEQAVEFCQSERRQRGDGKPKVPKTVSVVRTVSDRGVNPLTEAASVLGSLGTGGTAGKGGA